jgi:hypothetical protein
MYSHISCSKTDPKRGFSGALLAMGAFSLFGLFKKEEINLPVVRIHQARIAHEESQFQASWINFMY